MHYVGRSLTLILALVMVGDLDAQVRYTVRPITADSLMLVQVTVRAPGEPDGVTRFALPEDRFGVAEMWRWVRDVAAGPASELVAREPGVYEVVHRPNAPFEVSYTVAYDPTSAGFRPFGPSVDADHFHFFGSQWMARVGPAKGSHDVRRDVEVALERNGWAGAWASSFGIGDGPHRLRASDYDLDYSVIAGGAYRSKTVVCRGRPILVAIHGEFGVTDAEIFGIAEPVACGQREVFADFDRPFFTVFVTERADLEAGAPLLNGFTAFVESATSREEIMALLAHEMIHTWLPRSARLVEADALDAPESRTLWFHEGFTEYLARLTLVEQGLMPPSWMVDRTNEDLERIAYQPYRTATLDELEAASREGRYSGIHHGLHYVRGALLALNWDTRIRRGSDGERSIVDPVRLVVQRARERGGTIERGELTRIFERFGVHATRDIGRYLEGGLALQPDPEAFGPGYELVTRELPDFEPGFDVIHWLAEGEVAGVKPGGPAHRAGLLDGMTITRSANAAPWFGRWDPSQPAIFLVEREESPGEGGGQRFEVSAAGERIEVASYEPRDDPGNGL
jgi:predicted metalloprotease with PDZ domain